MEFQEYMNIRNRMTNAKENDFYCKIDCSICPLHSNNNNFGMSCDILERQYPEKAEAIVQKWAEEHPIKTRLDKMLEVFPTLRTFNDYLNVCPIHFDEKFISEKCGGSCDICKKSYWSGEYEEVKGERNDTEC